MEDEIELFDVVICEDIAWLVTGVEDYGMGHTIYMLQRPDGKMIFESRDNMRKSDITAKNNEAFSYPKKTAEKSLSEYRKESNTSSKKKQSIAASVSIDSNIAELILDGVIYEGNLNRLLDKLDKELYDGECTAETLADLEDLHFEREHRKG